MGGILFGKAAIIETAMSAKELLTKQSEEVKDDEKSLLNNKKPRESVEIGKEAQRPLGRSLSLSLERPKTESPLLLRRSMDQPMMKPKEDLEDSFVIFDPEPANEEHISSIMALGFGRSAAIAALKDSKGDVNEAATQLIRSL